MSSEEWKMVVSCLFESVRCLKHIKRSPKGPDIEGEYFLCICRAVLFFRRGVVMARET
jgi:hypothetical protein